MMHEESDRRTAQLFRAAIRADVHTRVDDALDRLATSVDYGGEPVALERALEGALADVADAVAEGLVAQMREIRRSAG